MNIASLAKLLLLAALAVVLVVSNKIVLMTIIGVGLGVLLSPKLDLLHKKLKISRGLAAFLILISSFVLAVLVIGTFGWVIADQTHAFIEGIPEFSDSARIMLEGLFKRFPIALDQVKSFNFADNFSAPSFFNP